MRIPLAASILFLLPGCAELAGISDLEVQAHADSAAPDAKAADTASDTGADTDAGLDVGIICPAGMVAIPGGSYRMDASGTPAEVAPFCMDVTEVTYGAYRKCAEAGRCAPADATVTRLTTDSDDAWRNFCSVCNANYLDHDEHPLNCVDWIQAHAYCAWLGRRLPTTEEWEWAARGAERGTTFPWGNDPPGSRPCWSGIIPQAGTCPANAHPEGANQFGVRDLAGNLVEWTATEGPLFGDEPSKVARGGSWFDTAWEKMSPAAKLSQRVSQRTNTVGFRCVK